MKPGLLKVCLGLALVTFAGSVCQAAEVRPAQAAAGAGSSAAASDAAAIDDATLHKVALASLKLMQIKSELQKTLQGASDPSAKDKVIEKAKAQVRTAMREQGLSLERFNQVVAAAEKDQGLSDKIQSYMAASDHSAH